ncbi:hypothetical protein JOD54_003748 [Actinokineospora baliensis]|uniref:hypothetical protein n=1 Tax=Actinokineospora baliensis TaxID=547056 RepID=UPI00195C3646|nr:hypothetical protein [Actinokineospora baliensis]MBM7773544.1 hypothetical protein [Actinokineospora baliensis]
MPRSADTAADLRAIADEVCADLTDAYPALRTVVQAVVLQAAGELVIRARAPREFRLLLHRRADARLAAMAGVFTPIRSD